MPNITRNAIVNCAELVTYDLIKELILKYDLMTGEAYQKQKVLIPDTASISRGASKFSQIVTQWIKMQNIVLLPFRIHKSIIEGVLYYLNRINPFSMVTF